jgi:magnesium-protoporphyrin IX monomethyl ester (oxidative) cyclase
VFPVTLDLENPVFIRGLERMRRITESKKRARAQGGILGFARNVLLTAEAGITFIGMFVQPAHRAELPGQVRMAPAW